jgi:predicted 3-demethylubiquinone-9 3-methyltransferase (glyoxalase superfamily)
MSNQTTLTAQSIRPCLTFKDRAEEALNFYVSIFPDSEVLDVVRASGHAMIPDGKLLHSTFRLGGQEYTAFDGGESFAFSEAFSLVVTCETQQELDRVWERLCEGGQPGPCGWLTDRFGLSWQVVPAALGEMMGNPAGGDTGAVMEALLKMGKLDIATLRRAYASAS